MNLNNESIQDRAKLFLEYKGINQSQFCISVGKSTTYFNRMFTGSITTKILNSIEEVYPELSFDWLLYGKGEMLIDNKQKSESYIKEEKENYIIKKNTIEDFKNSSIETKLLIIFQNQVSNFSDSSEYFEALIDSNMNNSKLLLDLHSEKIPNNEE